MNLTEILSEFKTDKNITRPVLQTILQEIFTTMIIKKYGSSDNFDIIINDNSGDIEIYRNKNIVHDGEVEDSNTQISITDAKIIQDDLEIGEDVSEQIELKDFGYRNILIAKQLLKQKVHDKEEIELFNKYKKLIGEIITVTVHKISKHDLLVNDINGNILNIPLRELNPRDKYYIGTDLLVLVEDAFFEKNRCHIHLTRNSVDFIEYLFFNEVREIEDDLVTIKKVARDIGNKTIILVESYDTRHDACAIVIGRNGSHIKNIQSEIGFERIEVLEYSKNKELLIRRYLKNYNIVSTNITDDKMELYVSQEEVGSILKERNILNILSDLIDLHIELYAAN